MEIGLDKEINQVCQYWQSRCGSAPQSFPSKDKTIQDSVHGAIEVQRELVYLLDSVMMQRLRRISQLGLANFVFPGANHTRFEHSLGVMHLAGRLIDKLRPDLELTDEQVVEAKAAGLLHDIGHLPFSHGPEPLLDSESRVRDQSASLKVKASELMTMKIIQSDWMREIFETINKKGRFNLSVDEIARMAVGYPPKKAPKLAILGELSHANFDADRMDYLMRDAHYSGVPLGTLDIDRLIRTARVGRRLAGSKHLVVDIKGLSALESMVVARSAMYSAVYFHHAVRAVNDMVVRAICDAFWQKPIDLLRYDDMSLFHFLAEDQRTKAMIDLIRARRIFKPALTLTTSSVRNKTALMDFLEASTLQLLLSQEKEIDKMTGNDGALHYCILDLPKIELYQELETDIKDGDGGGPLRDYSEIAKGVEKDPELKWRGYVFGTQGHVDKVREAAVAHFRGQGLEFKL